jgi:HSP20 family protein
MSFLIKPEPFSREVDRLFDRLFDSPAQAQRWAPAMDLTEADDHYVLKADLPGVRDEDVSIEVENGLLTISGERKAEHERSERGFYRIERAFGRFQRQLTMPEGIDPDAVSADFDRGVLSVRIPKPAQVKPRRISIGAGANGDNATLEGTSAEKQ